MRTLFELNDEQSKYALAASRIAREVLLPATADVDAAGRFPREGIDALAGDGLFGLTVPQDHGGAGQVPRAFAAVAEELAQGCASTAMIYVMHVAATQAIAAAESRDGRNQLLGEIATGRHLTTLAFSERGSRSQFWAPVSRLETNGDGGFVVDAQKSWVTSAHEADSYVSSAMPPQAKSPAESTLFLVRRDAQGVEVEGGFDGLGLRGNDSSPVRFQRLAVRESDLLTPQGDGLNVMLQVVLPWFVVGTAAMANGLCLAATAATAKHLSTTSFQHENTKLRDLPNLRARIAQMSVRTEQSRALLARATRAMELPDDITPLLVLQSRLAAIEAAIEVTDLAMKACGGAAFSKHLGIERLFRDARAGWVMAPTADHLNEFIGRALTGLPLF